MGWWSEDIMGGDTPLDLQGSMDELWNILDEDMEYRDEVPAPSEAELIEFIKNNINGQVKLECTL